MRTVTPELRRKRLLRLATYLVNLPPQVKFDMTSWGEHAKAHEPVKDNYCGTSACALGHAGMIPEFNRAGLRLEWHKRTREEQQAYKQPKWFAIPTFGDATEKEAGRLFFGLSDQESDHLFYATDDNRDTVVLKLLRLAAGKDISDVSSELTGLDD